MKRDLAPGVQRKKLNVKAVEFARAQFQRKEKGPRRALRCRRSPSGSADVDRLRVDGVYLNI